MSSELSRSSSPRWTAVAVAPVLAIVVATLAPSCVGPDAFNRDAGPIQTGLGGNDGIAGQTGSGGSGAGGAAMGGHTGAGGSGVGGATGGMGGKTGTGGSATGGRTGTGGSAPGVGGRGTGGAIGTGGALANDAGNDGDAAGAGGAMGMGGAGGCPPGIYCDNFESYGLNLQPPTWTRTGGSAGDWAIISDGTQALAQNHAQSSTFRAEYSSGATGGAPWSGATTLSVQVKVTLNGSSSPTVALACVRYTATNDAYCLALMPGMGAQLQSRNGQNVSSGSALFSVPITVGTQYNVQVSIDAGGMLSASLNGTALGTLMPGNAIPSGFVAVATQSAEATFDNVVVTQP
jgi:hypothetical protein